MLLFVNVDFSRRFTLVVCLDEKELEKVSIILCTYFSITICDISHLYYFVLLEKQPVKKKI